MAFKERQFNVVKLMNNQFMALSINLNGMTHFLVSRKHWKFGRVEENIK